MTPQQSTSRLTRRQVNRHFRIGLARAMAGALLFSLPLLMTMEMWWLGFYMQRLRLALLLLLLLPLLVVLSYHAGFEESFRWKHNVLSAGVAYGVGCCTAAVVLLLLGIIRPGMPVDEIIGKIVLQAVPGSIGAVLARSQLGIQKAEEKERSAGGQYAGEIFLMATGALFLAFNVAPTEEMVLIAYKMTRWHAFGLALVSLVIMHTFVYAIEFRGQETVASTTSFWAIFLRFTIVGYAVVLLISAYILWTFGRTDLIALEQEIMITLVLGFPAAIGAAAARLIL